MHTKFNPDLIELPASKLSSMAIVGHTTASSCKIWVRTYKAGPWRLVLSKQPFDCDLVRLDDMGVEAYFSANHIPVIVSPAINIQKSTDLTAVYQIQGLSRDTKYYYTLVSDISDASIVQRRAELGSENQYHFKTPPSKTEKLVFGYYSCHDPFSQRPHSEGAWPSFYQVLKDKNAAFCIGGGDQMYVDTNKKRDIYSITEWLAKYKNDIIEHYSGDGVLDEAGVVELFVKMYRMYYRLYWNQSAMKKVLQQFPQYMAWDDHEIMDGWGSYTQEERQDLLSKLLQNDDEQMNGRLLELLFHAAKNVYFEYQHAHNPDTPAEAINSLSYTQGAQGLDYNYSVGLPQQNPECIWDYGYTTGPVACYVLDVRGHHDYERSAQYGNALLGDAQMQRLKKWLHSAKVKKSKAVFIATAVPVVHWGRLIMNADFVSCVEDDLRDEWDHPSNWQERDKLLNHVMSFSQDNNCPVTFLSGDVHCASIFRIESRSHAQARVFNATSSAISRKPNKKFMEVMMAKDGKMSGSEEYDIKCLNVFSGSHNFMTVTSDFSEPRAEIHIDLHWPGENDDIASRRTTLE